MGKSKTLPFSTHDGITTAYFDLSQTIVWSIAPIMLHSHYK